MALEDLRYEYEERANDIFEMLSLASELDATIENSNELTS